MTERLHIAEPKVGLIQRSSEPGLSRVVLGLDPSHFGGDDRAFQAFKMLQWYMPPCIPTVFLPSAGNADWMVSL
jgi:hypothetical protein